eukprot:403366155
MSEKKPARKQKKSETSPQAQPPANSGGNLEANSGDNSNQLKKQKQNLALSNNGNSLDKICSHLKPQAAGLKTSGQGVSQQQQHQSISSSTGAASVKTLTQSSGEESLSQSQLGKRKERGEFLGNTNSNNSQNQQQTRPNLRRQANANAIPESNEQRRDSSVRESEQPQFYSDQTQLEGQTQITSFFGGGPGATQSTQGGQMMGGVNPGSPQQQLIQSNKKQYMFKAKRHPKSLMKEGVSTLRYVEGKETIFQIIMPWRQEKEDEEKKKVKKQKNENELKQSSLSNWMKKPPAPKKNPKDDDQNKVISKEELKYQEHKFGNEEDDEDMSRVSKVIKVKEVQSIRLTDYTDKDAHVQAILINPKWKISQDIYGDGDTEEGSMQEGGDSSSEEDVKQGKGMQMKSAKKQRANAFQGITMKEFSKLVFPQSLVYDGILFIWVEKEYIMDVCKFLEDQNFFYIENMCWIMLDENMREEVEKTRLQDATPAFVRENYTYFKKSKKTLLMFRRLSTDVNNKLELRHQRTGDVVFDWKDTINPHSKPQYYTYKLIETLLPKAMVDLKKQPHLRMIELWAEDDTPRKGWIKFIGLNQ